MQLTTHTDYALRLLIYLAVQQGSKATIQDAAIRFDISANHLAKVAQTLVQHNYIISHRTTSGPAQRCLNHATGLTGGRINAGNSSISARH